MVNEILHFFDSLIDFGVIEVDNNLDSMKKKYDSFGYEINIIY